jgi:group I intron endonuclease
MLEKKSGNICTIYLLTNTINNKVYVGQTWLPSLQLRMGKDGSNYKNSIYLYNSIIKHGADNFNYSILAECYTQEDADVLEEKFIKEYNSQDSEIGYNIKDGGSAGKHSDESKGKISNSLKEYYSELSPEEVSKRAEPIVGWWKDKEREPYTAEWKENVSEKMKEWHANNEHPMQGKQHTDETKKKISEAGKGRVHSKESVLKRSEKRKMNPERENNILQAYKEGKTISEIEKLFNTGRSSIYRILERNNIPRERENKSWTGKKHTEETKQKMADARKRFWEEKN